MATPFSMIYLLGGSGYVGQAYQALLERKGIPFRNLRRAEVDYTDPAVLPRRSAPGKARFPGQRRRLHRQAQRRCLRDAQGRLPVRQRRPSGIVADACAEAGVPWGHVSSGCIYNGARADGRGFTEEDTPNFTFRSAPCSFYSGTKALGEEVLAGRPDVFIWRLRIPFDNPRQPPELPDQADPVCAAPRGDELDFRARRSSSAATFACWEKRVPFGIYNVTNPGRVTTREVVELIRKSGVCQQGLRLLRRRGRIHAGRRQDPPVQLRPGLVQARPGRHPPDGGPRGRRPALAGMAPA